MDERTVQRIEQWPSRGFSGGYATLRDLADGSFSGAVRAAGAWLFMLNGRVIGVFEGRMESFADADGTVFDAPNPAPVLVFAMLETGGDQRGQYYTEDTPLSEVDDMLSGGGFTGYVELSENVLSGDYYVAYYGGKSMSAAFVGASEDLVTEDEAFDAAADEVGIFEVTEVELDVADVPEPADDEDDASAAADAGAAAGGSADDEPAEADDESADDESASLESPVEHAEGDTESAEPADGTAEEASADDPPSATEGAAASAERSEPANATSEPSTPDEPASTEPAPDGTGADGGSATERPGSGTESTAGRATEDAGQPASGQRAEPSGADGEQADAAAGPGDDVFSEEAEWRETNTVPALDPDESEPPEPASGSRSASGGSATGASASRSATAAKRERDAPTKGERDEPATRTGSSGRSSANRASSGGARRSEEARERIEQLEAAVAERDERIDDLESELASARAERDDLREERDRLEAELASMREELATARERAERAGAGGGESALSPADALAGTNLFVRYDSKGEPTLDAVTDGAEAEAVNANLRVEHHTTFDASDATVDGEPFEAFLQDTLEYEFVSWLVRRLPYEIRDAGHQSGLGDLYRVVPEIDRAELDGVVEVENEEGASSHSFDVVCRDKRGRPLVVAELNANREPVVEERMTGLVESATAVAGGLDSLGAGFYVTESFFKPDALSAATGASEGGLLSRDKRESFVKVGRKTGYHLCLVEARGGSFHVSIPEL